MSRAGAHRPVPAGFCGAVALLLAVVTLLCALGQVEGDGPATRPAAGAEFTLSSATTASDSSAESTAPCGKKAISEHSVQRADGAPQAAACPGHATPQAAAAVFHTQHAGTLSGGPAPPTSTPLHSVLRI